MMTLPDELLTTLAPIMESVAHDMSRRYSNYGGSHEDFYQEAWIWVASHPKKIALWFDPDLTAPKVGEKMLAQTLRNELADIGEDLKAQHLGYSRDDLSHYSRAMLRELLPSMFDDEAWLHPEQGTGERRAPSDPAAGGNWVATLADVSRAYDSLDASDRDLLAAFHRDEYSNKLLSEMHDVTEQTMSYRHDQAVKRLLKALGGPKDLGGADAKAHDAECEHAWRSGRRAVSNASARAYQQSVYEEGE